MPRTDDDFKDEIEAHIALEVDRLVAAGVAPADARAAALKRFGNVTGARERFHESRRVMWLEDLRKDISYALRSLQRTPGFAAVAVFTLALGIGANTAIFGVVYQTLLKPLPLPNPEQLVTVRGHVPQFAARFPTLPVSAKDFLEYRRSNSVFAALSVLKGGDFNLTGSGEPERIHGARVSANFFSMLGVRPALGRDFLPGEDTEGRDDVVLISDALWRRRFAADPAILNQTISLDGRPRTVVGVMTANLLFPTGRQLDPLITFGPRVDIWRPVAFSRDELGQEGNYDYALIGRLKPGITSAAARQDMARVAQVNLARIRKQEPDADFDLSLIITPLHEVFTEEVRNGLVVLEAAVGLLLLIACVNLANLLLVRLSSREREMATRAALGAGRGRLIRQLLTESLVVTGLGAAAGVALALWAGRLLVLYGPQTAVTSAWALDGPVLMFAGAVALVTGVVFGALPALRATGAVVQATVKDALRVVSDTRGHRLRGTLVTIEVALCTGLLAVAGLLLHSFVNVMRVETGYAVERVLAVDLSLPEQQYTSPLTVGFYRQLIERVRALPGVTAAGAISLLPIAHEGMISMVLIESDTQVRLDRPAALRRSVTPELFAAMEIPLVAGRTFREEEPALVAIISESLARKLWPGASPSTILGRGIRSDPRDPLMTIVGIAGDVHAEALDRDPSSVFYHPLGQKVRRGMTLVVRTASDPLVLAGAVRAQVGHLDANLPIAAMRTMKQIVSESLAGRRFQVALVVMFGMLALALAVVGIYGVTSYAVARRTQEIGLRIALGAGRRDVLRSVLREGLGPVAVGAVAGLAGAQLGTRLIRGVLFGIGPLDPIVLVGVTVVLIVTAAVACYLPARAAAALDPISALRTE
jgi:predicted permease